VVDDYSTVDLAGIEGVAPADLLATTRSVMGAPLRAGDKVVGVVSVASTRPRRFTEEELKLLLLVADRAAPAVERAHLLETVRARGARRCAPLDRRRPPPGGRPGDRLLPGGAGGVDQRHPPRRRSTRMGRPPPAAGRPRAERARRRKRVRHRARPGQRGRRGL